MEPTRQDMEPETFYPFIYLHNLWRARLGAKKTSSPWKSSFTVGFLISGVGIIVKDDYISIYLYIPLGDPLFGAPCEFLKGVSHWLQGMKNGSHENRIMHGSRNKKSVLGDLRLCEALPGGQLQTLRLGVHVPHVHPALVIKQDLVVVPMRQHADVVLLLLGANESPRRNPLSGVRQCGPPISTSTHMRLFFQGTCLVAISKELKGPPPNKK